MQTELSPVIVELSPALVERLQLRHALANERRAAKGLSPFSLVEFVEQLAGYALDTLDTRDKAKGGALPTPTVKPSPVKISLSVEEALPVEPSAPSPVDYFATLLWGEVLTRLRVVMRSDIAPLEACAPLSLRDLRRLTLSAPTPYLASDLQERIGGLASSVATEIHGSPVEVVWVVSEGYSNRMAQAEVRDEEREAQRRQEDFEREQQVARLVELYARRDVDAAKEAALLLVTSPEVLGLLPATSQRLVTEWVKQTTSGADYQSAKESVGRWGRKRPIAQNRGPHE